MADEAHAVGEGAGHQGRFHGHIAGDGAGSTRKGVGYHRGQDVDDVGEIPMSEELAALLEQAEAGVEKRQRATKAIAAGILWRTRTRRPTMKARTNVGAVEQGPHVVLAARSGFPVFDLSRRRWTLIMTRLARPQLLHKSVQLRVRVRHEVRRRKRVFVLSPPVRACQSNRQSSGDLLFEPRPPEPGRSSHLGGKQRICKRLSLFSGTNRDLILVAGPEQENQLLRQPVQTLYGPGWDSIEESPKVLKSAFASLESCIAQVLQDRHLQVERPFLPGTAAVKMTCGCSWQTQMPLHSSTPSR